MIDFLNWAAFLLLMVAESADVITTKQALKRGGREENPLIDWFMKNTGENGWIILKMTSAILIGVLCLMTLNWIINGVCAIVTAGIAWHNTTVNRD